MSTRGWTIEKGRSVLPPHDVLWRVVEWEGDSPKGGLGSFFRKEVAEMRVAMLALRQEQVIEERRTVGA